MSSSEFIKVSQGDARTQNVNVRDVKPVSRIKVVREDEESISSEGSEDSSEYSDVSVEPSMKKTKKVLRKREPENPKFYPQRNHDFSAFSNPRKMAPPKAQDDYSESEYSEGTGDDYSEASGDYENQEPQGQTFEEKQTMKQDLLIKIAALEKKGFEFTKKFTMTSNYEEMMFEYTKIKKFIETQAGIKFARRCLMACVTGLEFLNKKFDPFAIKLEGWSENVMENVDDYDNVFERLHEKYSSKAEVSPEIELLLMVGGSAFMFHLTNSLLKGPALGNILAQNGNFGQPGQPDFMASMMGAMNQGMKDMARPPFQKPQNQSQQPPVFAPPMETRGIRKEMRGPTLDQNLFSGTPLTTNYPAPPGFAPPGFPPQQNQKNYYDDSPINDDDRYSIASSSDTSVSTVSLGSTVRTLNINKNVNKKTNKKSGGVELNIK
jgi:hypothetical protein